MDIKNKIKKIKESRLKPEEKFLIGILNDVEPIDYIKFPKSTYYHINGDIIFEVSQGSTTFDYKIIEEIHKYIYEYNDIANYIKKHMKDTLDLYSGNVYYMISPTQKENWRIVSDYIRQLLRKGR